MDLPYYVRFFTADGKEHGFDFLTLAEQDAFLAFLSEYVPQGAAPEFGENQTPEVDDNPEPRYSYVEGEFNGLRSWNVLDGHNKDIAREHWPSEDQARVRVAWLNNPDRNMSGSGGELTDWEYDEEIPF